MAVITKPFYWLTFIYLLLPSFLLLADCCGKIDGGPAFVHIDVLESGKTIHRMDVGALKLDANWKFWGALIVKPTFLYGVGKNKDEVAQAGVGLGVCIPVKEKWLLIPSVGVNWGWIQTGLEFNTPSPASNGLAIDFIKLKLNEKFRSISPYAAFEASYTFAKGWRLLGQIQYSYSRTHTIIKPLVHDKSHSEGFTYSAQIEHDLSEKWSINAGTAYNLSLTKEKHGMRLWGFKLGIAYWF